MSGVRKRHSAGLKAGVATEAVKQEKMMSQLSGEYGVHPDRITQWEKKMLADLPDIFSDKRKKKTGETEELRAELYRQIGQLRAEPDRL